MESVGACKDMKRIFFLFVLEVEFGLVELCLARVFVGDFNLLGICAGCFFLFSKGLRLLPMETRFRGEITLI